MTYKDYSFDVKSYRIKPPVGRIYNFGAKVVDMRTPEGDFLWRDYSSIGEYLRPTEQEAFAAAHEAGKTWIDERLAQKNK